MKYSIIIPVCNQEELTKACIESIRKNTSDYEIITIDNGSKPKFYIHPNTIRNEKNLGFPKAINQGIQKSSGDIIILLNNDTVVSPHWADTLAEHLKDYDMVGPVTNNISGLQKLIIQKIDLPKDTDIISEKIRKTNAGKSMPYHRLVFFCVAIKREVIEKIGLLDEQYSPGNYEDDDYCLKAVENGFKLGIAEDCFIYHKGSASKKEYNTEYAKLLEINLAKFQAKWSREKYNELVAKNIENCKEIITKQKQTLALVMVVKNEEVGLARAIESCKNIVDEIHILVDEASTDKTLQIAKLHTNNVKTFKWFDDFGGARNLAHKDVKTDWILFLDGHEYIQKCERLQEMLKTPADVLLCTVELDNGAQIRNPRIYRNGLQFEGKIHEIQNYESTSIFSDFIVKHARVGGQEESAIKNRSEQSDKMVTEIMGEQLKKDKKNTRASFHLANHYQAMGNFKKALEMQNLYLKYSKMPGERWLTYFNRALGHFALGNNYRAIWATNKAEKETQERWELAKIRGIILMKMEIYQTAISFFIDSFEENKGDETYKPMIRNNAETFNLMGECHFRLGEFREAGIAFIEASKKEKDENKKELFFKRGKLMEKMSCQN